MTNELHFFCVLCGHGLAISDVEGGGVCECPHCQHSVPVPPGAESAGQWADVLPPGVFSVDVKFACPGCATILESEVRNAGRQTACPTCEVLLNVPTLAVKSPNPALPRGASLTQAEIDFLSGPADART